MTLTAPIDPRLPNGGGYPVSYLTRNDNSALGATDSYYTSTSDFGDETRYWHGVDVSFNARFANGLRCRAAPAPAAASATRARC